MENRPLVTGSIRFVAIIFALFVAALGGCTTSPPAGDACQIGHPDVKFTMGAGFMRADVMAQGMDAAQRSRLGMFGNALMVRTVAAGLPASRAGLVVGDRVVRINGFVVPDVIDANAQVARHIDATLRSGGEIKIDVVRRFATSNAGATVIQLLNHSVTVTPELTCSSPDSQL